jgi:hypothetical protein
MLLEKNYNENLIVFVNFIQTKNISFCAAASVGKLCLKKLLRSIIIFNKTIERFWQEAI